jgi:hypothetical protein
MYLNGVRGAFLGLLEGSGEVLGLEFRPDLQPDQQEQRQIDPIIQTGERGGEGVGVREG